MTVIQHGRRVTPTLVITSTGFTHSGDSCLPADAIATALRLIGAVHEEGPHEVAAVLHRLDRQDLVALAVTLAAMVPDDYTPVELLAWNDSRYTPVEPPAPVTQPPLFPAVLVTRQLKPHGTHAAFALHRKHSEEPCDACWHGEREYQRNRKRNNRAAGRRTA